MADMDPLRRLEVFRAVAETSSFTGAADELHLSQPAVSRTVRDLERLFGTTLFERTTRSVDLTPQGKELLHITEDLLGRYDAAMGRFAAYCQGDRGSIVIAALPSVAAVLLPSMLAAFLADNPEIRVEILDVATTEATLFVRTGRADVALVEESRADDLVVRPLFRDRLLAVLPERHHLARQRSLRWSDLANEPFIAMSRDSSVRRLTDLAFSRAGAAPNTLVEARNVATAGGLIEAGLGVSAMPELVMPLLAFAPLAFRELRDPEISRSIAALTRPRRPASPPARRFLDALSAHVVASPS